MAILELPSTLDLVSVNGQSVKLGLVRNNPYFHTLVPGGYNIEVGYTEYWGSQLSGELVRSDIYKLALTLKPNTVYLFEHTDPGTKQLINQDRFKNDFSVSALEQGAGVKTSATFSRPYTGLLGMLTSAAVGKKSSTAPSMPASVNDVATESNSQTVDQLKYWWQRASKEERGSFLHWSVGEN